MGTSVRGDRVARMVSLRVCIVLAALVCAAAAADKKSRNPKPFFASISSSTTTSTVTSTLNTATFCYTATTTITAACKRKKRSVIDDSLIGDEALPAPSRTKRAPRESKVLDLESSAKTEVDRRDPRFFLLLTSTVTHPTNHQNKIVIAFLLLLYILFFLYDL